jgi:CspA family cold shock protein
MRERGTVKWFNANKGYGFIGRQANPDVFVHFSQIRGEGFRTLQEGDEVEFEVQKGPKGPEAVDVAKV